MHKYIAAALLLSTALAGPAYAQETEGGEFSGFSIGGAIGLSKQSNDGETVLFDRDLDGQFDDTVTTSTGANAFSTGFCGGTANTAAAADGCRSDDSSIEYSGRVGLDFQSGSLVYGIIGEIGTSDYRSAATAFSITPANYVFIREIDYLANLRARFGFTATPTTLIYVTGGGGYAKLDNNFTTTNTVNGITRDFDDESFGYVLGGGLEQKLGRSFSIGLEYLYQRYQDDSTVRVGPQAGTPATNPFILGNASGTDFQRSDTNFDLHSLRATATLRF